MTAEPPSRDRTAAAPPIGDGLGDGVAWAIDAERALVVAASPLGAAHLGMRASDHTLAMDAGMPAIRRLREIAGRTTATTGEVRETLLFWTPAGAEHLACRIRGAPAAPGVLIVQVTDAVLRHAARDARKPIDPPRDPDAPETAAAPPPGARDDAATLREIARRIREGQAARAAEGREPGRAGARDDDPDGSYAPPANSSAQDRGSASAGDRPLDIAKLAHELKTPLSAIVAAAEIMRDEQLGAIGNERYRGYASDIHDSARHALAVINSMLGGGSVASEHPRDAEPAGPQLFAQIDLDALVQSTVSAMRPLADAARVAIAADRVSRLPHIIADPVSVRQILLNLLTNAVKFTPAGGRVTVATRHTLDGPVEVSVADTGPGMSARDIARSLVDAEPAERTARAGGGLGIGLPLVRQLAEANGARIAIESEPGSGTTVVVTFAKGRVVPV